MLQRITNGWNFQRTLFLIMGGVVLIQSLLAREWVVVVFGGYFASMGLFGFGCAAGSCYTGNNYSAPGKNIGKDITDTEFEEVK